MQRLFKRKNRARRQNPEVKERARLQREEYRNRPEVKEMRKRNGAEYRNRPEQKQHMKEYYAEYYEKNKADILRKNYEHEKIKNRTDPHWHLRKVLRARVKSAILRGHKSDSTFNLLGCSVKYLREWLEFQFDQHMNWENHGTYWHIDHIKPCAGYDLMIEENQRECFCWRNMRPLEKKENMDKSAKIDNILIKQFKELADEYLEINPLY